MIKNASFTLPLFQPHLYLEAIKNPQKKYVSEHLFFVFYWLLTCIRLWKVLTDSAVPLFNSENPFSSPLWRLRSALFWLCWQFYFHFPLWFQICLTSSELRKEALMWMREERETCVCGWCLFLWTAHEVSFEMSESLGQSHYWLVKQSLGSNNKTSGPVGHSQICYQPMAYSKGAPWALFNL